jgi:hypothetical protein
MDRVDINPRWSRTGNKWRIRLTGVDKYLSWFQLTICSNFFILSFLRYLYFFKSLGKTGVWKVGCNCSAGGCIVVSGGLYIVSEMWMTSFLLNLCSLWSDGPTHIMLRIVANWHVYLQNTLPLSPLFVVFVFVSILQTGLWWPL